MDFKRIVIITDAWEPQVSGVVTTLKKMVELSRLNGYQVEVIHPGLFKYNLKVKAYPEIPLSIPLGLNKLLKHKDNTVYHIATEGPLGLAASFILTFRNKRYTTSYHTDWSKFMKDIAGVPSWITKAYIKWFHYKRKVFCPTKTIEDYLRSNGIGRRHIIWSRGADENIFQPRTSKFKNIPLLVSVGRISKEKNLDVFCSLPDKYIKVVVGDGPYKNELQRKYPKVIFPGYKFGEELAQFYQTADCLVFTSKSDTFGVVLLESMFCGTPVAAYPVQGPIDVIDEGITGCMDNNIEHAIEKSMLLSREKCSTIALNKWSWHQSWVTFISNLEKDK